MFSLIFKYAGLVRKTLKILSIFLINTIYGWLRFCYSFSIFKLKSVCITKSKGGKRYERLCHAEHRKNRLD